MLDNLTLKNKVGDENLPEIVLDESGNSGSDLLNADSPILTIATIRLSPQHMAQVESLLSSVKSNEWKFTKFRKYPKQINLLIQVLQSEFITSETTRVHVVHKRFFAVTKFIDLIYEPLAKHMGTDLYEQGAALALANLFATVLPVWLGEENYSKLMRSFVKLVRQKDNAALVEFRACVEEAHGLLEKINTDSFNLLTPALLGSQSPELWLPHVGGNELDPLIPSYHSMVDSWGQIIEKPFKFVSDKSKALRSQLELFNKLSSPITPSTKLPSVGGRWVKFPYRAVEIEEVERSQDRRDVQLADLIAGCSNSVFSALADHQSLSGWQEELRRLTFDKHLLDGGYWPSRDVTPEDLEATHVTGEKAVDFVGRIIGT